MLKDISKHSLVFVVIRKHDQVPLVPRAKSVQRATCHYLAELIGTKLLVPE